MSVEAHDAQLLGAYVLDTLDPDERRDVDTVHDDVVQFAADFNVDQLHTAHPAAVERCTADLRPAEVDSVHPGLPKTDALEPRAGEVLIVEPGHRHHGSVANHNQPYGFRASITNRQHRGHGMAKKRSLARRDLGNARQVL